MKLRKPFRVDPSATGAFGALGAQTRLSAQAEPPLRRAVVIGGGTGAPMSIRTLLSLGVETSAVVAMADDGGSTGILREEADVTPPGDVRKCIAAFARNPQDPLVRAFRYRFAVARDHALGNLMLAALEDASGSFPEAIAICERLLDAQGHVYPSTLDRVTLEARTRDGRALSGQAAACHSTAALERVELRCEGRSCRAYEPALEAIRSADLIVLGPGSLFTSVIANLLVPGVVEAVRESRGRVLFVCSLADVQGETWGLTAREHVEALYDHGLEGLIDYVLVHSDAPLRAPASPDRLVTGLASAGGASVGCDRLGRPSASDDARPLPAAPKRVEITYEDARAIQARGPVVIVRNLADAENPAWHAPLALREAFLGVMKLCRSRQR